MEVIADTDLLKNNDHQTFETTEVQKKSFTKDKHKDNNSNKCIIKDIYESEEFTISSSKDKVPARIKFFKNYLSEEEANDLYATLVKDLDWQQKTGTNKEGKEYSEPRLTYWFGKSYKYSSVTWEENQQWHPKIEQLREALCNDGNFPSDPDKPLNSVMCNYYRDNNDSIGWHSDDEASLGRCPTIASISLGCTRVLEVVKRDEYYRRFGKASTNLRTIMYRFHLGNGSLLVMDGSVQDDWLHQVPKVDDKMDGRINLTFRHIVNDEEEKKEIERKKKLARERRNNESKQRQLENRRPEHGRSQDQYDYYKLQEYEYHMRYRKYYEDLRRYEDQYRWAYSARYDSEPEQNYYQNDYNYEQGYNRKNVRRREDSDHNKPYRRKNSEGNDDYNGRDIEESMKLGPRNWEGEKYPENRNDNDHREFQGRNKYRDDNNKKGSRRGGSNRAFIDDEGDEQYRHSNHGYSKEIGNVEERAKGFGDNEPQRGNIDGRSRGSRYNTRNINNKGFENQEEEEFVNNKQHRGFSDRKGRGYSHGNKDDNSFEENCDVRFQRNAQNKGYGGRGWRDDSRYDNEDALQIDEEEEQRRRSNDNRSRGGGNRNPRGSRLNYSNSETMPYEDHDKEQFRGNKQNRGDGDRNRNRPRSSYNPDRRDQENQDFDSNRNFKRGVDQSFKGPRSDFRNKDSTYGEEQEDQKGRDRNMGSQSNYREQKSGGYKQQRYNSESNRSRGRGSSGISFHDNRDEVAFVGCNERMFSYHKDPDESGHQAGHQQQEEGQ